MMKIKITLLLLLVCGAVSAQSWNITGTKTRFTNGLGIPVKTITSPGAADTALIFINLLDTSTVYWRFHGALLPIGGSSSLFPVTGTGTATGNVVGDILTYRFELKSSTDADQTPTIYLDQPTGLYYFGASSLGGFNGIRVENDLTNSNLSKANISAEGSDAAIFSYDTVQLTKPVKFNSYGVGVITGTPAYNLSVDASGNVIETSIAGSYWSKTGNFLSPVDLADNILVGDGSNNDFGLYYNDAPQKIATYNISSNLYNYANGGINYDVAGDLTSFPLGNVYMAYKLGVGTAPTAEALTVAGNTIPSITGTYQIGTASNHWLKGYIDTLYTLGSSIHLGDAHLTDSGYAAGKVLTVSGSGKATWVTPGTGVSSVSGTANQIGSTGGATPVISLVSGGTLPGAWALGTPASVTLTNGTGLPIAGITGLGTGVATALGVNTGSAGAFQLNNGSGTGLTGVALLASANTFSVNGAASTPSINITGNPYTAGTATTNYPLFYMNGGTAPTTWSTAGTYQGINAVSGFTGNLVDYHVNGGASVFKVAYNGVITATTNNSSFATVLSTGLTTTSGQGGNNIYITFKANAGTTFFTVREITSSVLNPTFNFTGSQTMSSSYADAIYASYNPTLIAAANNQVINTIDVDPTFTNGAFTGVVNNLINLRQSAVSKFKVASDGTATLTGNMVFSTAGKGVQYQSGTGARAGNAVLVGGTVTVTNTSVTANTVITLTRKTAGGVLGNLTYTLSAGASFTINSDNALDTSVVTYVLDEVN